MPLDITLLEAQGASKYVSQFIEFNMNSRNAFRYKIKFLEFVYSDEKKVFISVFLVERYVEQSGIFILDITYRFNALALHSVKVNKWGVAVPEKIQDGVDGDGNPIMIDNPDVWGSEFERMSVMFSAEVSDSLMVESYISDLFNLGLFDFPKNQNIG